MKRLINTLLLSSLLAFNSPTVFSQENKSQNISASFRAGICKETDSNVNKRYGSLPLYGVSVFGMPYDNFSVSGGLLLSGGNSSFKYPNEGIYGKSHLNYFMLEGDGAYRKAFESNPNMGWFLGGGLIFSQIKESATIEDDYGNKEKTSGADQSLGVKLFFGLEGLEGDFKGFFSQIGLYSAAGDYNMNLVSFELGRRFDFPESKK